MKIVINACFGGFGLSHVAVLRYAEVKGITVYAEVPSGSDMSDALARLGVLTYWTKPAEERPTSIEDNWHAHSIDERAAYNKAVSASQICPRDIARDDPALVQVVEEMGRAASGRHADLRVVEIPDGVKWEIAEYDGSEHVAEQRRTWYAQGEAA